MADNRMSWQGHAADYADTGKFVTAAASGAERASMSKAIKKERQSKIKRGGSGT